MTSNLVIPCHWDLKVLEELEQQNDSLAFNGIKITDFYGALAGEAIGNGRCPKKVKNITREEALVFREKAARKGFRFNYLLNSSIPLATNPGDLEVYRYLDWIVHDFNPDALVIASRDLMSLVRKRYGDIPIHVSTIARVSSDRKSVV